MRICVLGLRGMPDVLGGIETHCEQLFPNLKRGDDRIVVLTRACYCNPTERQYQGIELAPLWTFRNKHLEAITHSLLGVLYAWLKVRPDILHIHAIGPGLMTPLARLLGMRVVVTHHGADYKREKWSKLARRILKLGEWLSVRFADRVIVVSASAAEELKQRFPARAARIAYIPNGAPVVEKKADTRAVLKRFGLKQGKFILSVGRLVPEKGFLDLIQAFRAADTGDTLVIAGAADHTDAYSAMVLAQGDARVIFTGFQTRDVLATLYGSCALFVLASHHEGLPIAALEAAAAGAPMLLSDISANRDVGLAAKNYFPVGNIEELTAALEEPRSRYKIDREPLVQRFDWRRIADQTRNVYAEIGAGR